MKSLYLLFLSLVFLSCEENPKKVKTSPTDNQNWITINGTNLKFTKSPLGQFPYEKSVNVCNEMKIDTKENWRLPSQEDLVKVYNHIKTNNIGGFGKRDYWSNSYSGMYNGVECYYRISFVDGSSNKYGYSNNEGYMVLCVTNR